MSSVVNSERLPNVVLIPIGTQAATITLPGMYLRKKSRIKAVHLLNNAAITADNTNYLQLSLQNLAGLEYATLDTRAANDGAVVARTPKALTQVSAQQNRGELEAPADESLQVVVTKNGTAVPTLATLQVEYYPL